MAPKVHLKTEMEIPFVVCLSAPRKSGKTYFIKSLLKTDLVDHFDEIHIFNPSNAFNDDYWADFHNIEKFYLYSDHLRESLEELMAEQQKDIARELDMKRKKETIHHTMLRNKAKRKNRKRKANTPDMESNMDIMQNKASKKIKMVSNIAAGFKFIEPEIFEMSKADYAATEQIEVKYKRKELLLVLDDCIDSGLFDFRGLSDIIAERGRHFGVSAFFSTQRLTALSKSIRIGCDYFDFFKPHAIQELESFIEKFVSKNNIKAFRKKFSQVYSEMYMIVFYDPNQLEGYNQFKVGKTQDFIKGHLRPMFSKSEYEMLTT